MNQSRIFLTLAFVLLTFLVECFSLAAEVATPETQRLSMYQAIQIAIDKSPSLNVVRQDLTIRNLDQKNSFSGFLPQLDLNATYGLRDRNPSLTNRKTTGELSLQLTENLYDNGLSLTKYQSAKLENEVAQLTFTNERDKLILEITNEFMRYSLAKSLAAVQDQQFKIVNKQYVSVSDQYHRGVKTQRDYLKFKTELRRAEIEVQNSQTEIERARLELMRLLGFEMSGQLRPFEFIPIEIEAGSVAHIPTEMPKISNHPQYRIQEMLKQVSENDVQIVRRQYWPELFVTAGANYDTGDYLAAGTSVAESESTHWNALLTLKYNLWDWGTRNRNISIAKARQQQTEQGFRTTMNSFASENSKLMLELNRSSKNYALARELLGLESDNYNSLDLDYRNGKINYLVLIVGLRDLLNAKVQMYTSYFDLRGQLLKYRYHEGKLYESISETK